MQDSQRVTLATGSEPIAVVPEDQAPDWRVELSPSHRYEHRRELGRGGMGEVALAFDRGIDRAVAVKRLRGSSPDEIARFVDEARVVGRMEHPNIVPVHDIGIDPDGRLFFVMKYVEGDTLRHVIERLAAGDADYHRRYPFQRRLDLFQGLIRALQYAHHHGILHRDVKPENVMVGACGELMLMDWGIACSLEAAPTEHAMRGDSVQHRAAAETRQGCCIGTPPYMSPEQAAGRELDGRSDLYSAFVVLYELISLHRYIGTGKTPEAMLVQVQERELPKLHDRVFGSPHQPAVPAELRHLLRRGLRKPLEERHPDAEAVLDALIQMRSGAVLIQCPITFVKHVGFVIGRILDARPLIGLTIASIPLLSMLAVVYLLATR